MVATIRERLSLKNGIKQHLIADRYNLNKLVDRETRKEHQIDVANRFSDLEGLEISSVDDTWVKIRDSIKAFANLEENLKKKTLEKCIRGLMNSRRAINLALIQ